MKLKSLLGLVVVGFAFAAMGADNGKMIEFTCSGYAGASTLANFPVLVRLAADAPAGFRYSDMLSSSTGAELRFYDEAENPLPHEIESWDPSGTSYVWVKVPALSKKSAFTMYYGRTPSGTVTPAEVWNSGYAGVWHFAEASGAVADATGHGLTATPAGTTTAQVATDGPFGKARVNANASSNGYLEVANDTALNLGDAFTVSGWYNMSGLNGNSPIVGRQAGWFSPNGWMFEMTGSYTDFAARGAAASANAKNVNGSLPSAQNSWVHFTLIYKGTNVTVYANGARVANGRIDSAKDNDTALMFGYGATRSHFYGAFDEFRLASGGVSEDWIRAEYAQAGTTFLSAEVWDAPDPTQKATLTVPALDHCSVGSVKVADVTVPAEPDGTYLVPQGSSVVVKFVADPGYALSASKMSFKVRESMSIPSAGRPVAVPLSEIDLVINEIGASNDEDSGIVTAFGGKGLDWIELRNRSSVDVDVNGWYLTDGPDKDPEKWTKIKGDGIVPANGYRIVWASKDFSDWASSEAHVAISLSTAGEPLLLAASDETHVDEIANFGKQLKGVSCGRVGETVEYGYFTVPTPGAANGTDARGRPTPLVTLSEPHGYKTAAFALTISCAEDPTAEIRYTLDGSSPTASSTKYTGPIQISKTTVVRAAVPVANSILQTDAAATYLFVDDILQQSADNRPAGFPATSASGQSLVYGLATAITQSSDPDTRRRLLNGFTNSIRTVSLVIDPKHMFDDETGIYVNPSKDGREWERQTMLEQINPTDSADGFTASCGIKIRGAFSRGLDYPKHSFHLVFRSEYGAGKLEFPLFGEEGASSFDRIDLRTSQNCSWANTSLKDLQRNLFTLIEDVFSRDTQRDMGQPYNRSRYYNLFINGVYWGIYQTEERVNQYCGETNNGGKEADYDVVRTSTSYASSTSLPVYTTGTVEGEDASWNNFYAIVHEGFGSTHADNYNRVRGLNSDGTRNPAYPVYLNAENLIDYMLIAHWTCNCDTPAASEGKVNNQAAYRNRIDGEGDRDGFLWHLHDCEYSLGTYEGPSKQGTTWGTIRYGADTDDFAHFGPALINCKLMSDSEYRQLFADLAYRHLFRTDATLSASKAMARFGERMAELDEAVVCESARWGNGKTRADWLGACQSLTNEFMRQRSTYMKMAYRAAGYTGKYGWYPSIDAPMVRNSSGVQLLGGETVDGSVTITGTDDGTVYYTTDGSDPRLVGGGVSASAKIYTDALAVPSAGLALSVRVKTAADEWSALEQVELKGAGGAKIAEALRFHSFDGVTTAADADSGEWIVLTNLSAAAALDLEGVRIVIVKDGDPLSSAKCDFTLGAGTSVPAAGSIRLEQAACGWTKITNNKIHMYILTADGTTVQTSEIVVQKNFATYYGQGGPGGMAHLVATAFGAQTTGEDWIASEIDDPPVEPFALGEPTARPSTNYNGSVVTVTFTGDLPDGASSVAKVRIGGKDYVGTIDVERKSIALSVPAEAVTAGNVYLGLVTVTVGGIDYSKPLMFTQGTLKIDENADWVCESATTFGSTGTWTGDKAEVSSGKIAVSNATFTASDAAPFDAVVTVTTTLDFGAASVKPLETSSRAGIQVVNVGGVARYTVLSAFGEVTNLAVVAKLDAAASVTVVLSNAENTVSYAVDSVALGTYPSIVKAGGVSTFRYTGGTTVAALNGSCSREVLSTNLAQVAGTEYATVAEALAAAGSDPVKLLWDSSWTPTKKGDYTLDRNGFVLAIGGSLAYSVKDNGDGTITVSVTGGEGPVAPSPTSITISGSQIRIGVAEAKSGLWYALEKTTDLSQSFAVDASTWVSGDALIAGTKELVVALGGTDKQAFYRVVVSTTSP